MRTVNEIVAAAPADACFRVAADVERWPEILPHYRRVRFHRKEGFGRGRVEMAAYRHFGPLPYPVWWESEMVAEPGGPLVRYHHVAGITEGMDVWWRFHELEAGAAAAGGGTGGSRGGTPAAADASHLTRIEVVHEWDGPGWPLVGGFAARRVIGPHFVMVVADRTLAGIRRAVQRGSAPGGQGPAARGGPVEDDGPAPGGGPAETNGPAGRQGR